MKARAPTIITAVVIKEKYKFHRPLRRECGGRKCE